MSITQRLRVALGLLLFATAFSACTEDNDLPREQQTVDPYAIEATVSELAPIFDGVPNNDEIPADGKFDAVYPKHFDLAATQSPVRNQGGRGVCSIFSTVALMEHLYLKEGTIPNPDFSEQFLQWSVKFEVGAFRDTDGSNASQNLTAINRYGVVQESIWPYQSTAWNVSNHAECTGDKRPTFCYTNGEPTPTILDAQRFKLPPGRFVNSRARSIKAFMTENQVAVIAGMTFFYQSWNHRGSPLPINSNYLSEGYILYPNAKDKETSAAKPAGHSILIVGWDDDLEVPIVDEAGKPVLDNDGKVVTEKGFFLIKNSWGTSGFGIRNKFGAGYGWLSMRYVEEYATVYSSGVPKLDLREVCDDGRDNDFNGLTDCDDPACAAHDACRPSGLAFQGGGAAPIPDNDPKGLSATIDINQVGTVGTIFLKVDIRHTYKGDLKVALLAPNGQSTIVHDRTGGSADDIKETYKIDAFNGLSLAGTWTLNIADLGKGDTGNLQAWSLEFILTGDVPEEVCDDGIDNDGNGLIDCADPACADFASCVILEPFSATQIVESAIPDGDPQGIISTINVDGQGLIAALSVGVDITHPFRADLIVSLIHPSGAEIFLFNQDDDDVFEDLVRTFTPKDFDGLEAAGLWQLKVVDAAALDEGTLNLWALDIERIANP